MPTEFAMPRFLPTDPPSSYISKVHIGDFRAVQEWEVALQARDEHAAEIVRRKREVLERPVLLAAPGDHVPLGACVQLLAPDTPGWLGQKTLALAVRMHLNERADPFNEGCLLKCSPHVAPCARTTFHVEADGARGSVEKEGVLKFGQRFVLRPAHALNLVVRAEMATLDSDLGSSGFPQLRLTSRLDRHCRWTVWPAHPRLRNAAQGFPVPAQARVVVRHEATGRSLAVETNHWDKTAQGFECEATVHSMLDPYGKETANNFWVFNMQTPADLTTPPICCNTST